ncbi:MAG: hypothetical protein J7463_14835 [Roseiflexus sp.]|jgi:hypothetical protein|nr:hypothetical protein [Roseiflexus sp.]MBO9335057.1 hypothetical protein [Roseiflexus sp.]MBO9342903.1 hypothetical protein [Roseiflexus sp.]MBO9365967.1 hypothetical protein [Roseiflexus sp.]MBO9383896.1 hypothetical protein [Roseiflexus sp.]
MLAPCSSDVRDACAQAERIAVVLKHWPVDVHLDVLAALALQTTRH